MNLLMCVLNENIVVMGSSFATSFSDWRIDEDIVIVVNQDFEDQMECTRFTTKSTDVLRKTLTQIQM